MKRKLALVVMIFVAGICLLIPGTASAQTSSGTVVGVASDSTGAVIPDVKVVLSNPSKGTTYSAVTNSAGSYRFTNIPPGPGYQLVFAHEGFSDFQVSNIYVNVANIATENARMVPGQQIKIIVNAGDAGATLNTEDATVGNNFQISKMNDLPVQSRLSPRALFTLQPGVATDSGGQVAVTGARTDQSNVTVDGLDVNDFGTGNFGSITGNAPVDAMQEFRGTTAGFTSSSGQGSGGQFQLVTRSGTNHWHGQISEYHRDNSTTANDWFNNEFGIHDPKLVRNQFGGNIGGPIIHNKAFFFFDYENSRTAQDTTVMRTVPLASYMAGNVSYINNSNGCTFHSRQNTTPNCISQLTPAQVQSMDPAGIGESPAVYNLLKSVYPAPNDLTAGDGVNTGGFRFNSPDSTFVTTYTGRLDYNLTQTIKLKGIGTFTRENAVQDPAQFPGDPLAGQFVDRSYRYLVGMDWQISPTKINQLAYGTSVQDWSFPRASNPLGVDQVNFASGTTTLLDDPYSSPVNAQARRVPIPQVQDNFVWDIGRHSISIGGTFKWIHTNENTVLDYNTYSIGLGGEVQGFDANVRPANLLTPSATAQVTYDSAFAAALGRVASINTTVNYDNSGNPLPQGTGSRRSYKYYQTLAYISDSWKVTPNLTLTYGLNYQYFSVPYEANGLETVQTTPFDTYIADRVQQSKQGISGANAVPFFTYVLGGPKNHGPAYYNGDPKDFGPRVAFSWNPEFDHRSVFNGSFGIVYDRTIVSAVQYQQDQYSYLFQQPYTQNNGDGAHPDSSLATDPRYDNPPAAPIPTTPKPPYTPWVAGSDMPYGLWNGGAFNEMVDPTLKTPYSMLINFGFQHEFPGSTFLKLSYVGRLGRRLLAQADSSQLIDFPDLTSGEMMSQAMGNITREVRGGQCQDPDDEGICALPAEPWFENQVTPGIGAAIGYPNNTSLVATALNSLVYKGDFADTIQALAGASDVPPGLLDYNVGMAAQLAENSMYTNKGFSSYNGLLVTVQKNLSHGLEFTGNYTWSHSIDNVSVIANSPAMGGYGFICDALRPRLCRGNSDFDTTHYVTGYFTYALPFGRGRAFANSIPWGLNEIIGGWNLSNIFTWHSGTAYSTVSSAFVAGYANDAPALFNGDVGALKHKVHKSSDGALYLFADPDAAVSAFQGPIGFNIGPRNSLRGPQFFNMDAGLAKTFEIWPDLGANLQFRADAFNVLNHPNFDSPGDNAPSPYQDITGSNFGQLTSMNGSPRVLQLSARFQF